MNNVNFKSAIRYIRTEIIATHNPSPSLLGTKPIFISFAKQLGVPITGIIENMSGFVCPDCGAKIDIFKTGAGQRITHDPSDPYLGSIPIDSNICNDSDNGSPFIAENKTSPATKAFTEMVKKIEQFLEKNCRNCKRTRERPANSRKRLNENYV